MRPNVLFVGPMKSGTTWVHDYLLARDDVCMPRETKETFFFDRNFADGIARYEAYFQHFDPAQHGVACEIGPSLFHKPEVMERVAEAMPQAKIVFTLRDPMSRAWSHYLHMKRYGYTSASLKDAVTEFPEIVAASQYDQVIAKWREVCPGAEFHQLHLEALQEDEAGYIRQLCDILGIPFIGPDQIKVEASNEAAAPPSMLAARYGRKLSYFLKDRGAYAVVNAAKSIGLHKVIFGAPKPTAAKERMDEDDTAFLKAALAAQRPI